MDEDLRKKVEQYIREQGIMMNNVKVSRGAANAMGQGHAVYSLAEVQLVSGDMIGMTVTASPTLGAHLTKEMSNTGFLYIYNETESLIIKSDLVAAIKLTKITKE
jgi:hypothetical protein